VGNSNLKLYFENSKIGNVNKNVNEIQNSFGIGFNIFFQKKTTKIHFRRTFFTQIIEKNESCLIEAVFTFLELAWNSKTFLSR
jgi:hypothetical protein